MTAVKIGYHAFKEIIEMIESGKPTLRDYALVMMKGACRHSQCDDQDNPSTYWLPRVRMS